MKAAVNARHDQHLVCVSLTTYLLPLQLPWSHTDVTYFSMVQLLTSKKLLKYESLFGVLLCSPDWSQTQNAPSSSQAPGLHM